MLRTTAARSRGVRLSGGGGLSPPFRPLSPTRARTAARDATDANTGTRSRQPAPRSSGDSDGPVRLWEANSGQRLHALCGQTGVVWNVALSADGRLMGGGGEP
jgi:hypothetical protein